MSGISGAPQPDSTPPPDFTPGQRIRWYREKRGMTRPVLAGLVGRGPSWLKKIERGERETPSYELLSRLAGALNLADLSLLTGGPTSVPISAGSRVMVPYVSDVRDAVRGRLFGQEQPEEGPGSVDILAGRVSGAWQLWHASRFQRSEVGNLLPDLIRDAQALTRVLDGTERRRVLAVLASIYQLAQQAMAYSCEPELYWVIADRARSAAQDADDPLSLAGVAWSYANGLRETGYTSEAIGTVREAADELRPRLEQGSDDLRGMYGALNLHAAVSFAREGHDGDAWRHWDEANAVARRLPRGYAHAWTVFGQGNTDFHAISIGVDLRTPGAALQKAEDIDLSEVPSVERRARVLVELARAHHQRSDKAGALHYMNRAQIASPETVRYTPSARGLVGELFLQAKGPLKADAAALVEAVGLPLVS
ncbi:helix-turn-helix transcriptional regulator [Sphaerisporangium sp. NPDC051017]|uniref:helix-turn-helix domain-containing protein n=1 Tax=Sphaerisporangium sp. NPDC051017 TaxID=3154636 RepID=UPI003411FCB5